MIKLSLMSSGLILAVFAALDVAGVGVPDLDEMSLAARMAIVAGAFGLGLLTSELHHRWGRR
jgi:hypothetical protein